MGQFSGAGAAAAENKALAEAQTPAAPGFEETLIKYLAKHIIARLKPLQLPGKDGERFPISIPRNSTNDLPMPLKYIGPEVLRTVGFEIWAR